MPEPVAAPDSPAEEVEAVAPAAEPAVAEAEDDIPAVIPVEDDAPVPGPPPPVPEGDRWLCPMCLGVEADRPGNCRRCGLALEPAALPVGVDAPDYELRSMTWRLRLAVLLGVPLVAVAAGAADSLRYGLGVGREPFARGLLVAQAVLCTPIVLVCGWPFLVRGWRSLRTFRANLYTLTGLGVAAGFVFSLVAVAYHLIGFNPLPNMPDAPAGLAPELAVGVNALAPNEGGQLQPFFETTAVVVILTLLGQVLELRARSRTGAAIRKLLRLAPNTARVVRADGTEEDRPADAVRPGDVIRVRPGGRLPVDGLVLDGTTAVDESLLTGEASRVTKGPGDTVLAGTENGLGEITVEALRVRADTALSHIAALVGQAQRNRVPLQRAADRIAARLVPVVLLTAAGAYALWSVFGDPKTAGTIAAVCAAGVLVVSCPVALGLATPSAVVIGMGRAARAGILFRDGAAVERLAAVDTVCFDKTGTLTEGRMKLTAVERNVGHEADEVLGLAASVERGGEHPIGLAIVWEAVRRRAPIYPADEVEVVPGKGVRGVVRGRRVVVGRLGFLQESGVHHDLMVSEGNTHRLYGHGVVFVGLGNRCVGLIVLEDKVRANTRAAADRLWASKLRLVLVTGDHADTARSVARVVGIEEVVADTLPAEKYAVVQRLRNDGRVVAMCGDGVNDAPALAAAHVGIAMGCGSEAAITVAGVTLVRPDLRAVAVGRDLSRGVVRTIRQNLFIAFLYTAVAVPVAAGALVPLGGGLVSPVWAAAAMTVSSLAVVANSLRLYWFR
ncbi:MAG: heavy metal translocating P-type ATPase [Gemmataceae bacterium]|nr:heavy metal translocating P-type ATPase [Gemmataceae bacterium]